MGPQVTYCAMPEFNTESHLGTLRVDPVAKSETWVIGIVIAVALILVGVLLGA